MWVAVGVAIARRVVAVFVDYTRLLLLGEPRPLAVVAAAVATAAEVPLVSGWQRGREIR